MKIWPLALGSIGLAVLALLFADWAIQSLWLTSFSKNPSVMEGLAGRAFLRALLAVIALVLSVLLGVRTHFRGKGKSR
jgi:ABC-type dipeptide/oligopeptide/nickel transport system permease component